MFTALVSFVNSSPHSTQFVFTGLRLSKDSLKINHILKLSFIKLIEKISGVVFFCYPLFPKKIFSFWKFVIKEHLFCNHNLLYSYVFILYLDYVSKVVPKLLNLILMCDLQTQKASKSSECSLFLRNVCMYLQFSFKLLILKES